MNSEIALKSDIYSPGIDDNGNYIDVIINNYDFSSGLICNCGNKTWYNKQSFKNHTKTKRHIEWLEKLNNNKMNYYNECCKLKETVANQQKIIQKYENENNKNLLIIRHLSEEIMNYKNNLNNHNDLSVDFIKVSHPSNDLLTIDLLN